MGWSSRRTCHSHSWTVAIPSAVVNPLSHNRAAKPADASAHSSAVRRVRASRISGMQSTDRACRAGYGTQTHTASHRRGMSSTTPAKASNSVSLRGNSAASPTTPDQTWSASGTGSSATARPSHSDEVRR